MLIFEKVYNRSNPETRRLAKEQREKIKEIKKTGDSLFVATPVHSGCDLHYMKSCLDLKKECLLHNVNITFQIMQSSLVTR